MTGRSLSLIGQPRRAFKSLTSPRLRHRIKLLAKNLGGVQLPTNGDNIFIFSAPRSGSTWLLEMILSQPAFRACDQPLDLRNPYVRENLGVSTWDELHDRRADRLLTPYLQAICDGRIRGLTTLWSHRRLVTRRLVFKIQNGWQERIAWMRDSFGGRVVLLLRHPIAVTLSRQQFPRLKAFLDSSAAEEFGDDALTIARRIAQSGSPFEQGVLHWCFETAPPLRRIEPDWIVITYEQLVTEPEPVVSLLSSALNLPDPKAIMGRLARPSRTTGKSSAETQKLVGSQNRRHLISKWRPRISEDEERRAFEIIQAFGVDAYRFGRDMPTDPYLVRPDDGRSAAQSATSV